VEEWTLSGVEAEALHMEEEDLSDDSADGQVVISDDEDPLQKIIQSRYCCILIRSLPQAFLHFHMSSLLGS
jgi:hypothetical protein